MFISGRSLEIIESIDKNANIPAIIDWFDIKDESSVDSILEFETTSGEEWTADCEECEIASRETCAYLANNPRSVKVVLSKDKTPRGDVLFSVEIHGCEEASSHMFFCIRFYDGASALECMSHLRNFGPFTATDLVGWGFDLM
jgi:hypothetical protein